MGAGGITWLKSYSFKIKKPGPPLWGRADISLSYELALLKKNRFVFSGPGCHTPGGGISAPPIKGSGPLVSSRVLLNPNKVKKDSVFFVG